MGVGTCDWINSEGWCASSTNGTWGKLRVFAVSFLLEPLQLLASMAFRSHGRTAAALHHAYLVDVWMQAAACSCFASCLVLMPLIGHDLGDAETIGYLLQASIACRIIFCLMKVAIGLSHTYYLTRTTAKWSEMFGTADVDQDGRIDRNEWIAHFGDDTGFDLRDIGHDGGVSHDEFLAYEKSLRGARKLDAQHELLVNRAREFGTIDLNQDGRIVREEWIAHFGDDIDFDLCDKIIRQDGAVSRAEFLAYIDATGDTAANQQSSATPMPEYSDNPWDIIRKSIAMSATEKHHLSLAAKESLKVLAMLKTTAKHFQWQ